MLKIYNSLAGNKQVFRPIQPGKVRMYVCGMTVYDYCHLGHARVMVVFDMVARYFRAAGFEVTYVRNITDIDDKIIQRANENGETIQALTCRFIEAMEQDAAALGVQSPEQQPRATEHINQMLSMIRQLLENKYAYVATNGDVLFDVSAFSGYGKLSGKKVDELRTGEQRTRGAKQDPLDFALWKAAKPGEPNWPSPWGAGRPGWHIECSAMSVHCLGEHFDIHGGGQDLQFPHHENEIAQSEGATGKPFANFWMHNGFVQMGGEKMSKSLDNFFTVREILKHYPPEAVRFFILTSHYRSPLNYSQGNLNQATAALKGLYTALKDVPIQSSKTETAEQQRFMQIMDDDFNTPEAIALLHALAHDLNRLQNKSSAKARQLAATLKSLGGILGLLQADPETYLQTIAGDRAFSDEEIEALLRQRVQARTNKDFTEADRIRNLLAENGIILEDSPMGTIWRSA